MPIQTLPRRVSSLDPKDYAVAWMCPRRIEYIAARAFLDEIHHEPEYTGQSDIEAYTLGRVGEHNVAIMLTENFISKMTPGFAKQVEQLFPDIVIRLIVGIDGGAPSAKPDIRLGDIAVNVSKIKINETCELASSGRVNMYCGSLPMDLLLAVKNLGASHKIQDYRLEETINSIIKEQPSLFNYHRRPEQGIDRLCKSIVDYLTDYGTVHNDDLSKLISRAEPAEADKRTAIHYSMVAWGHKIRGQALLREEFAVYHHALIMGWGSGWLERLFHGLLIRAVSDYSGEQLDEIWHGYAVLMAAASAKALLHQLPLSSFETTKTTGFQVERAMKDSRGSLHSRTPNVGLEESRRSPMSSFTGLPQTIDISAYAYPTAQCSRVRPCYIMCAAVVLIIVGSGILGIYYTVRFDRMGDGFTAASWIVAIGALVLGGPAAHHYPYCTCWNREKDYQQRLD